MIPSTLGALAHPCLQHQETLGLPPSAFNKCLLIEPTMPGLVLQMRIMDKQESTEPAGEARTGANTFLFSPSPSNASPSLGEGHHCFQLADPVSRLPFRTQHPMSHPRMARTDCLSGRQFTSGFQRCPSRFTSTTSQHLLCAPTPNPHARPCV